MASAQQERVTAFVPLTLALGAVLLHLALGARPEPLVRGGTALPPSLMSVGTATDGSVEIRVRTIPGTTAMIANGADGAFTEVQDGLAHVSPDRREAARLLTCPISLNWRHPLVDLPVATIVRLASRDRTGRLGPEQVITHLEADHGHIPVLSLVIPQGALFDPDSGLMVVGNAIFHAPEKLLDYQYQDPRWWKYPGNFHMRGRAWERTGSLTWQPADTAEGFARRVTVRINGQMTRAFPQHALRIGFEPPLRENIFAEEVGDGYASMVVRSAGNDQIKAMLRDAYQHELCKGASFGVSGHRTCVLYVNGAYWGVHHLRHRMDEEELARRYGVGKKKLTILEDEARFYYGDAEDIPRFERLAYGSRDWNGVGEAWADTLRAHIDTDGFLAYMASQMILGNMDWPQQNVRFWRYRGKPRPGTDLDGRWHFIMGDSDLGFGAHAGPETDLFLRVNAVDVPITRLFKGMMRNERFRTRFIAVARELAMGPLSSARSLATLDRFVNHMAPEMERHTARWRRPADVATWEEHIAVMRNFAARREAYVLDGLERLERNGE